MPARVRDEAVVAGLRRFAPEVADGLAAAQAQLLGDRHVIPPLRALAAVLDPP